MMKLVCLLAITACVLLAVKVDGESRILGGQNATNGQFPHHVQIRHFQDDWRGPHCGGSIIGDRFVLTTAECLVFLPNDPDATVLRIIVGEVDLRADAVTHLADILIFPPDWNIIQNNIAVVRVIQPFKFTDNVRAIQLPTEDTPVTNDGSALPTLIVGWGAYKIIKDDGSGDDQDTYPWTLQWLNTTAISHPECRRSLNDVVGGILNDNHICAKSTAGAGFGTCHREDGGGLITVGAQPVVIGVLAWISNACVSDTGPALYTRVFPYLAFIRSAMAQ